MFYPIRDPISIFISSWDYYGFDKILNINIEEFADMVSEPGKFSKGMYREVSLECIFILDFK